MGQQGACVEKKRDKRGAKKKTNRKAEKNQERKSRTQNK
jgi:hypothetical protein